MSELNRYEIHGKRTGALMTSLSPGHTCSSTHVFASGLLQSYKFSYKMEDQASVCAEVVKKISSEKVHIIAHSMGGAIGLR